MGYNSITNYRKKMELIKYQLSKDKKVEYINSQVLTNHLSSMQLIELYGLIITSNSKD